MMPIGNLDRSGPTEFLPQSEMVMIIGKIAEWLESPARSQGPMVDN
jgi:hypothetical protein